jgi:hypothetical protein
MQERFPSLDLYKVVEVVYEYLVREREKEQEEQEVLRMWDVEGTANQNDKDK